jgi:dTDP-4-dehydrorhamnose 3,5-epimerase
MKLVAIQLAGLVIIEPEVFGDRRGFFLETYNLRRYREGGVDAQFVQDNLSKSGRSTLRGLHYQKPHAQGKLVSVLEGEVFDVVVDIRRGSLTFKQWKGVTLSADNKRQVYLPPGFAHGFMVLSDSALFHYKCTDYYYPRDEMTIRWDDPDIAIDWPLKNPKLSTKDANAPFLKELPVEKLFD